jgi:hypothetical protein
MVWGLAGVVVIAVLAFAGVGLASASFTDAAGDNNEAPDVTSVTVSEPAAGMVTVSVAVRNYQSLPDSTWFNLWFDLDLDPETGDAGDEALARYLSNGSIELYRWDGEELMPREPTGMTADYSSGVLTLTLPKAALDDVASFGILAVASRGQQVEENEYTAADFAPDAGRSAYVGPGPLSFSDPSGDHPSAPDVRSVRVSDAKNGTISFTIATPNFTTLPRDALVLLLIDRDLKVSTGAGGADLLILYQAGEVQLGRWDQAQQQFLGGDSSPRVQARNANGVLTLLVHGSELGNPTRFDFGIGAAHLDADDVFDALDVAPENRLWRYTLVNTPAVHLLAGKTSGAPSRPVAGKRFTVTVPVRRSDTGRAISTGSATCKVRVAGRRVAATGRVASGSGRCAFLVPETASGKRVTGSIVVRSAGAAVTARFAFTVR